MGFPVGYSELPRLLLHLLYLLGHVRRLITWAFDSLGLSLFLSDSDHNTQIQSPDSSSQHHYHHQRGAPSQSQLIRCHVPVFRFEDLRVLEPESCAVCLHDFEGPDEVRRPITCRHVFHRSCLDRWVEHGQRTCPLCRALLVPAVECSLDDECYLLLPLQFPFPSS